MASPLVFSSRLSSSVLPRGYAVEKNAQFERAKGIEPLPTIWKLPFWR
jgi:hypothetical protein